MGLGAQQRQQFHLNVVLLQNGEKCLVAGFAAIVEPSPCPTIASLERRAQDGKQRGREQAFAIKHGAFAELELVAPGPLFDLNLSDGLAIDGFDAPLH
jgi:hypothetical protein